MDKPKKNVNMHKGVKSEGVVSADNEANDLQNMVDKFRCSKTYYSLEDCLGNNDRKWNLCQNEVSFN